MKKKGIVTSVMTSAAVAALVLAIGFVPVSAAGTDSYSYTGGQEAGASDSVAADQSGYSYLAGRQRSVSRNDLYAQAEQLPEDEQDAFLAKYGIGETPYSEEAVASYGYVTGQKRGASYSQSDDSGSTQDTSGYSFRAGQMRGASYHK